MPLPHELRPAEVLEMTMDYLLNNVIDDGKEGVWADWYDFLWNRTRAIRKVYAALLKPKSPLEFEVELLAV